MTRHLTFLLLLMLYTVSSHAQELKQIGAREILVYRTDAKTSKGRIKGILQGATPDQVHILTDKGVKKINVEHIRSLKIKFDKKKNVPVFRNIAQAGLDIIAEPGYTRHADQYGHDMYGQPLPVDEQETSLGESLLLGGTILAGALIGNEMIKLVPPATIETFKVGYSKEKYDLLYNDLAMYTVDLQSSPEYDQILLDQLKKVMKKNTLKP